MSEELENDTVTQEIETELHQPEVKDEVKETKEEKPVSTRQAIKNALKEAKEKDEAPTTANAKQVKPVRAGEAKQDDKTSKGNSADKLQTAEVQTTKQVEAPRSWTAANKAEFSKLPEAVKTQIVEREKNLEALVGKSGQTAEYGNRIKEVFTPYDAIITAEGGTHEKAIKELLNSAYILRRGTPVEKARMVADTMRRFGVDLRVLNGTQQAQPQHNIQKLVEDGVKSQIQKFQEEQQLQSATREWQGFRDDPAHPHCDLVMEDMRALLSGGRAQGYQDAYEKAVWAHPELRSTLIQQTEEQRNSELKKQNDAKRRAGSSLSGAPGKTSPPTPQAKTGANTRDDIRLAMAQVRGSDF